MRTYAVQAVSCVLVLMLLYRYNTETLVLNGAPNFCIQDGWDADACVPKTMPVVDPEGKTPVGWGGG